MRSYSILSPVPEQPSALSKYIFEKEIGRGGFSVVYSAYDKIADNKVAVKCVSKEILKSEGDQKRFQHEVDTISTLDHPNICRMRDFLSDADKYYLILDYCEEGDLNEYLLERDRLSEPLSAQIMKQIISALKYCHKCGVAHRDIKPQNVLIDNFPSVKLTDFGLCGYIQSDMLMNSFCGSPQYCAPECLNRVPYDGRLSDVWSLGVLLYTMVAGSTPWSGVNTSANIKQIIEGKVNFPPNMSGDLKDLISKILQTNPHDRISLEEIEKHPWMDMADYFSCCNENKLSTKGESAQHDHSFNGSMLDVSIQIQMKNSSNKNEIISPFMVNSSAVSNAEKEEERISLGLFAGPSLPSLLQQKKSLLQEASSRLQLKKPTPSFGGACCKVGGSCSRVQQPGSVRPRAPLHRIIASQGRFMNVNVNVSKNRKLSQATF